MPGKMAPPSVPVTLAPPGAKPGAKPAPPAAQGNDDIGLGGSGNEAASSAAPEPEVKAPNLDLGAPGDADIVRPTLPPSADDVDLGHSGNEDYDDEPNEFLDLSPAAADDDLLDLGAPGSNDAERKLARDTAATMDIGPLGIGDLDVGAADLPVSAGKRGSEGADLPAPLEDPEIFDLPAPLEAADDDADLPAPSHVARQPSADLPAPSMRRASAELPTPAARPSLSDLPAPSARGGSDLPAPRGAGASALDLPAPAGGAELPQAAGNAIDLPGDIGLDLPASSAELPASSAELPASADDFFGDLPQAAQDSLPTPASELPAATGELPAPTDDFFGDLPRPAGTGASPAGNRSGAGAELPASADDFFGDLPQTAAAPPAASQAGAELDDPLGGDDFDPLGDIGLGLGSGDADARSDFNPPDVSKPAAPSPAGGGLDDDPFGLGDSSSPLSLSTDDGPAPAKSADDAMSLGGLELEPSREDDPLGMASIPLDHGGASPSPAQASAEKSGIDDLGDMGLGGGDDTLGLDLGLPDPGSMAGAPAPPPTAAKAPAPAADAGGDDFGLPSISGGGDDLGLPSIPASSEAPRAKPKAKAKPKTKPKPERRRPGRRGEKEPEEKLDLEDTAIPRVQQGHMAASALTERHLIRRRQRRRRIIMSVAAVLVLAAGTGGFFVYRSWAAQQEIAANLSEQRSAALAALQAGEPDHWERAVAAADKALAVAPQDPDALGIAAQGAYAAIIDQGRDAERWRQAGLDYTRRIDDSSLGGAHVDKAQALKSIDQGRPAAAISRLQQVLSRTPNDPDAVLYQGWAHAAARDNTQAAQFFEKSLELSPKRPLPALYGLGRAQLAQGDRDSARATFAQILEQRESHLGALVGAAQAADVGGSDKREAKLLEIVNRPDAAEGDPRELSRAWSLAAYISLDSGRIDEAGRRFEQAINAHPANVNALVGRARVALAQERYEDATEQLTRVIGTDLNAVDPVRNLDALLTLTELAMRTDKPDEATAHLERVFAAKEQIDDRRGLSRAYVMQGQILGADESQREAAIAAYEEALTLAGDDALESALALADLYTLLGRMEKARAVLAPVERRAASDAAASVALGIRYMRANAWTDAETWLRKALELEPGDVDAQFQLGQVLASLERYDEAFEMLKSAAEAAPERSDIGLRLAIQYEKLDRDEEAAAAYEQLLSTSSPTVDTLARAGRFYARQGQTDKAGEIGERILAIKDTAAAGHYLLGEGQFAQGEHAAARDSFRRAADIEQDPQYLEATARAAERMELYDEAFEAYSEASRRAPEYIAPRLGRARLLIARRDFQRATEELEDLRKIAPNEASVFHYLGESLQAQEKHKEAISYFRTALGIDGRRAETHYRLGKSYIERGDERDAASEFTTATQIARNSATPPSWLVDAYYELGYVQRALSRRGEAVRAWDAYLELVPEAEQNETKVKEVKRLLMGLKAQLR
ncbi:tetratricopeptide repeat protein [Haliangium ochraceum]|uniref:Tetratricopeptide TPR_2 repeat protein n=1 Tax=Haliangium ochraceum (strain DSM 14365 / JCM 11303 / SMP-2) TaxID=502025 RepID=D0LUL3_HALO1|nr:tetratricopeptide repeat protein [Haliangium ochraceum]ACY19336.1 Tetratricopeptide TPR_2 repeat protein [Haliangium ochraceum DSM 14365]